MVHFSLLPQINHGHGMHLHPQTSPQTQSRITKKTVHALPPQLLLQAMFFLYPEVLQAKRLSEALHRLLHILQGYEGNPQPPAAILSPHPVLQHL